MSWCLLEMQVNEKTLIINKLKESEFAKGPTTCCQSNCENSCISCCESFCEATKIVGGETYRRIKW